jgi:hypothetical protein
MAQLDDHAATHADHELGRDLQRHIALSEGGAGGRYQGHQDCNGKDAQTQASASLGGDSHAQARRVLAYAAQL